MQPDAVLARIVGSDPLLIGELTKKLWEHIRKEGLQDPKDRTMIRADAKLLRVFDGRLVVSVLQMTTCISAHVR